MAHQRKLIRHAVVDLLIAANTAAGARVLATRIDPIRKTGLPALSVYTLREDVDPDSNTTAPVELKRYTSLEVSGWVAHSDDIPVDDAMDNLAEAIENAMSNDPTFGGAAEDSFLESTEMQVMAEDGRSDPLVGNVVLTYQVTYRTSPPVPGTLDDFLTVNATEKVTGGVADTPPAIDTFTVQEP